VAVKSIKLGQVWRQDATGQDHLVTKVYSEVFTGRGHCARLADCKGENHQVSGWRYLARFQLYPGRGFLIRIDEATLPPTCYRPERSRGSALVSLTA
jgi:hypothetical protein